MKHRDEIVGLFVRLRPAGIRRYELTETRVLNTDALTVVTELHASFELASLPERMADAFRGCDDIEGWKATSYHPGMTHEVVFRWHGAGRS